MNSRKSTSQGIRRAEYTHSIFLLPPKIFVARWNPANSHGGYIAGLLTTSSKLIWQQETILISLNPMTIFNRSYNYNSSDIYISRFDDFSTRKMDWETTSSLACPKWCCREYIHFICIPSSNTNTHACTYMHVVHVIMDSTITVITVLVHTCTYTLSW